MALLLARDSHGFPPLTHPETSLQQVPPCLLHLLFSLLTRAFLSKTWSILIFLLKKLVGNSMSSSLRQTCQHVCQHFFHLKMKKPTVPSPLLPGLLELPHSGFYLWHSLQETAPSRVTWHPQVSRLQGQVSAVPSPGLQVSVAFYMVGAPPLKGLFSGLPGSHLS